MPAIETANNSASRRQSTPGTTAPNVYGTLAELARSTPAPEMFYRKMLWALGDSFKSPYAAVYVRVQSGVIQEEHHAGATDTGFWKPALQAYLTEALSEPGPRAKLFNPRIGEGKVAFLSVPVLGTSGEPIGALAMVVSRRGRADTAKKLVLLEGLTCFASYALAWGGSNGDRSGAPAPVSANALSRAAACNDVDELAFAITNSLRTKLSCEQVAVGIARANRIELLSISGLDRVAKQSSGVAQMRAAMEECLDAGCVIVCQDEENWSSDRLESGHRLHRQWRAAAGGDTVASIPLQAADHAVGVLSLRKRGDQHFTRDQIDAIRQQVEPFAPALLLLRDAKRSLAGHARDAARGAARAIMAPGRFGRKAIAAAAVLAVGWLAFGKADYELTVPCVVTAAQVRHVTAPFDGTLVSATALQGDRVRKGDVLCRMDQRALNQQRDELLAEISVLEREHDRATAEDDPVGAKLALAEQELAQTRLDIINARIEQCSIVSPIDGIVVSGDLRKQLGAVVALGSPMFEIAPLDNWVLELDVPEKDVDDLSVDLAGLFAAHARPEIGQPFRVSRVNPRAEVRDQKNVCVAEARADLSAEWIRPGMEGVAKVHVGRRQAWWVLSHRVIDYLRLKLWL